MWTRRFDGMFETDWSIAIMLIFKLLRALYLAGIALLLLSGTSLPANADGNPSAAGKEGEADFITYCAACHGIGGRGDGTVAEFLTIEAADLTQLARKNGGIFPRARAVDVIDGRQQVKTHGTRDMPVWGDWFKSEAEMSEGEKGAEEATVRRRIDGLADYIESIQAQ